MKRWFFIFILAALVVAGTMLVSEYLQPEVHQCYPNRKLYLADPPLRGVDVEELQGRLQELGFYPGPVSGVYDEETARAVREAQRALELEPTGEAELWFWPLLFHGEDRTQGVNTEPPPGEVHIEIYLHQLKLVVFSDGQEYASFPIAPGKPSTRIPTRVMFNDAFGTRWTQPWGIWHHGICPIGRVVWAASACFPGCGIYLIPWGLRSFWLIR